MNGAIWILVFITTAGKPSIAEPMTLESCAALLQRPEFAEAFCFNKHFPKLIVKWVKPAPPPVPAKPKTGDEDTVGSILQP